MPEITQEAIDRRREQTRLKFKYGGDPAKDLEARRAFYRTAHLDELALLTPSMPSLDREELALLMQRLLEVTQMKLDVMNVLNDKLRSMTPADRAKLKKEIKQ